MKKYKTSDGYHTYKIKKENKTCYLANKIVYQKDIDALLNTIDDLKYDSVIFIFGIDTGDYLGALSKLLCSKNKVFIFEPNAEIYHKHELNMANNIQLVLYEEKQLKIIMGSVVNSININNLYLHAFGNYAQIYKEEYDNLVEKLDCAYMNASACLVLANRFREVFIQNMLANLKILNKSTSINHYQSMNKNIPAIIISAGPSLDKNIKDMLQNKNKLENCFIITGSRTVDALIKNGIKPDIILSVDPVDANYDMMKNYLNLDIPLAFYEYSNRYLVRDYQGEKIYMASLFSNTVQELHNLRGIYLGGSVAHGCIDMANMLGCSPILLIGQDFAYTYDKHHSDVAIHEHDKTEAYEARILTKDVFENQIKTTATLNEFRRRLEEYIEAYHLQTRVEFINCSYGAEIKGAPHQELSEVFRREIFNNPKKRCFQYKDITIDSREIIDSILSYINQCIVKASQGLELCEAIILGNEPKSLIDIEEDDIDLQRILYILQIVNDFETASKNNYLGGYFNKFIYDIKQKAFIMLAKEYDRLTSDLQYQARAFKTYFEDMQEMLEAAKRLSLETVTEFYE